MYRRMYDAQKFFKNVKHLTEGVKFGASSCRDERGYLVTDAQDSHCEAKATLVPPLEKTANRHQSTMTG